MKQNRVLQAVEPARTFDNFRAGANDQVEHLRSARRAIATAVPLA